VQSRPPSVLTYTTRFPNTFFGNLMFGRRRSSLVLEPGSRPGRTAWKLRYRCALSGRTELDIPLAFENVMLSCLSIRPRCAKWWGESFEQYGFATKNCGIGDDHDLPPHTK
jgi:hypothetical protein